MTSTIVDLVSVRQVATNLFESVHNPEKMGNMADQAFGGNTLAVAVNAAFQTIPSAFFLYSALGNFLGPAFTDRRLQCAVREIRTTKTFATRHVDVSQVQRDGKRRLCLFLSADFQVAEPASLLTYSRPPKMAYSAVEDCPNSVENRQSIMERGLISKETMQMHKQLFGLGERLFDQHPCPEGISTQNLIGMAKKGTSTTQDHLPLPSKTSSDYFRSKHLLKTPAQHISALAFVMDMGLSFVPLAHTEQALDEVAAQSSLDFALRIFTNEVDLNTWNMREWSTVVGGDGRTYTEVEVWDRDGKMLCNMTQQCILRPKMNKAAKI
ncbi:hypothetical protein IMSHALPRED_002764 [Imshaugia aleurites]|uniref:Uncharacterized protein n=1 Tax=Imshaugia aleurites TaxID=172621 RepID=A0A8H3J693_9LECA|nr:hypothetical protein IMSHALPRED_002764 [Imshaugia aleurites]